MKKYFVPTLLSIAFVILLMSLSPNIPLQNQPQPLPTPTPTPTVTETKWQTYKNEKYKYSINHPTNWLVEEVFNNTTYDVPISYLKITNPQGDLKLFFGIKSKNEKAALSGRTGVGSGEWVENSQINFYGHKLIGYIQNEHNLCSEGVYSINNNALPGNFVIDNYVFNIEIYKDGDDLCNSSEIDTINQILTTFKFLPDTSTWKTYKNDKFSFEFKHPKDWQLYTGNANKNIKLPYDEFADESGVYISNNNGCAIKYGFSGSGIPIEDMRYDNIIIDGINFERKTWYKNNKPILQSMGSNNYYNHNVSILTWIPSTDISACQLIIDQILSTFKFLNTNTSTTKYTCPTGEWVDCMPGPGAIKRQCKPEYLKWAQGNCPNFKGAAL